MPTTTPCTRRRLPFAQPAPLDDVVDEDRAVVDRGDDELADFADAPILSCPQERCRRLGKPTPLLFAQLLDLRTLLPLRPDQRRRRRGIGILHAEHGRHRILAAAEQADAADVQGDVALHHVVAADVGVGVGQRVLHLLQGDAE